MQRIAAKEGDVFLDAYGAILDGAKLLDHFSPDGLLYVATNQLIDPNTLARVTDLDRRKLRIDHL
jgi:hypothetical protein